MSLIENKDKAMVGKPSYERREKEFYETPEWCTEVLLSKIKFKKEIWEPACGNGAIVEVLEKHNYNVFSSDIAKYEYPKNSITNFLTQELNYTSGIDLIKWDRDIITNPPYNKAKEFVDKALSLTQFHKDKVAMLLRHEWDCVKTRNYLFTEKPFRCKIVLTKRPKWIEGPLKSSPRHNFAWYVWDWQYEGKPYLEYQDNK